jgi:hypothetical protein
MSIISNHLLTAQFYPHSNPSLGINKPPVNVVGPACRGAGYVGGNDGLHTVQYSVTNFIGTIQIQATLCLEPTENDWFTVATFDFPNRIFTTMRRDTEVLTGIEHFVGKYTYVRANVDYTFGSIGVIQLNHQ